MNTRKYVNPAVTSYTSYGTISADSEYTGGIHPAWSAFDGSVDGEGVFSDKWLNLNSANGWLQWALPDGVKWKIVRFDLFGTDIAVRSPDTVELLGSNDGETWDSLVTADVGALARYSRKSIQFNNDNYYNIYRWNFPNGNCGDPTGIAISEIIIEYFTEDSGEVEYTKMSGADAAAMSWCIAETLQQNMSLMAQKKAFKDGLQQGIEGGADITEEFTQEIGAIDFELDENGRITSPFLGSFTDGLYVQSADGRYARIYLDMSFDESTDTNIRKGCITYELYDASGNLLGSDQVLDTGNWTWIHGGVSSDITYAYCVKWMKIDFSRESRYWIWTRWYSQGYDETTSGYWDYPSLEGLSDVISSATKITNIPPEIIS